MRARAGDHRAGAPGRCAKASKKDKGRMPARCLLGGGPGPGGRPPGRGGPEPGEGCASTPDGRSEGSSSGCGAAGGGVVAARHLKESMPAGRTRWRRCGEIRRRAPPRTRPSGPGRAGRCAPPGPPRGTRSPTTCCTATPAAARPDRRWVVDFTHVPTRSGFCCTAFVTGPVLPPHRRLGHRQPHGHRLRARRPGAGDPGAQGP